MKEVLIGSCLLAALSFSAHAVPIMSRHDHALAGGTVIDFESQPVGRFASIDIGDVTISGVCGDLAIFDDPDNGKYVPPNDRFLDNRFGRTAFNFVFNTLVSAFGLQVGATNSNQKITAYDSLDNVIETVNVPNQVSTLSFPYTGFYGINASTDSIARFTLSAYRPANSILGDWISTDDLTYVPARDNSVPEPASLALLGVGLAGLGLMRRRRRA